MNTEIRQLLEEVKEGRVSVDDALLKIKTAPFEDIGYAKVDLHRKMRQGATEVIFGSGKTPEQIAGIVDVLQKNGQKTILITRMSEEKAAEVMKTHPMQYDKAAQFGVVGEMPAPD